MKSVLTEPVSIAIGKLERRENVREADFADLARKCASTYPSAVLLSGAALRPAGENRYSLAGWDPLVKLTSKGKTCAVEFNGQSAKLQSDPLDLLDQLVSHLNPVFGLDTPPFSGGAMGYLAYDLKNVIERLPARACDDLELPELFLFWPRHLIVHDRKERTLIHITFTVDGATFPPNPDGLLSWSKSSLPLRTGSPCSNFTPEEYLEAIRKIRTYIGHGDVYQVNLSQRFQFDFQGDAFELWKSLFNINPTPFYAYINAGDHQVLSTSMERFLSCKEGLIESRPIKGTRKRGKNLLEDILLVSDLLESPKDDAELSMIVDLLRNDLGRICPPRTIRVSEHKKLESYENVHHLLSIITGELVPGTTFGSIIRATFPGGSITGCPKIRAMEIIDELEPNVRHIYTGAIGYIGWHGNLDLNVAIRTAIRKGRSCYFSVGGGIVYDSCEEDEYRETLYKGRTLFNLIEKIRDAT
jgi:para-aminobenzoate synthetase component 1